MADAAIVALDAGPDDAGLTQTDAGLVDAGPPTPPAALDVDLVAVGELLDGGLVPLPSSEADPLRSVLVRLPLLVDYRLRVIDDAEHVVPSDDEANEADGGIDYQVRFSEPLKTGHTYSLLIDAELGAVVHDPQGHPMRDLELKWSIRGPRQVDPKAPAGKKRKKR